MFEHTTGSSNFYPRPPGGGRQRSLFGPFQISLFLSTPSGWRATREGKNGDGTEEISIHALRVEGDGFIIAKPSGCFNFYPRPPGGGRPAKRTGAAHIGEFLSTPSGWRATRFLLCHAQRLYEISIHALRVEGDPTGLRCKHVTGISIHALRVEGDGHHGCNETGH